MRHLILGDAMTKLGKRVLPRYNNNIATLPKLHCHATETSLPRYRNFIVAAWQQPMFRYQTNLKEMLRLEDKSFRLEDRLADNPFLKLSASLYIANNVRVTAMLEDMVDFFSYTTYLGVIRCSNPLLRGCCIFCNNHICILAACSHS